MAKTTAPPEPSTPTSQPGPAQGADPAVVIARPADAAALETDAAALKQLAEDNGAGPRQEPVHRQTAPVAEVENTVDTDGNPVTREPPKPKKHGKTVDEDVEALAVQLLKAMETQSTTMGGDGYGREYVFYTTTMNNQSVVMAEIKRGFMAQQIPVSVAALSKEDFAASMEEARNAIRALDGMLV